MISLPTICKCPQDYLDTSGFWVIDFYKIALQLSHHLEYLGRLLDTAQTVSSRKQAGLYQIFRLGVIGKRHPAVRFSMRVLGYMVASLWGCSILSIPFKASPKTFLFFCYKHAPSFHLPVLPVLYPARQGTMELSFLPYNGRWCRQMPAPQSGEDCSNLEPGKQTYSDFYEVTPGSFQTVTRLNGMVGVFYFVVPIKARKTPSKKICCIWKILLWLVLK